MSNSAKSRFPQAANATLITIECSGPERPGVACHSSRQHFKIQSCEPVRTGWALPNLEPRVGFAQRLVAVGRAAVCDEDARFAILILLLTLLTVIRLVGLAISVVDLSEDEAQYWSWSRQLEFGYYSKPPLLPWLIAATTYVCGNSEWCVRSSSPILYFATSLLVYYVGRSFYDDRTGFWAALLTALTTGVVFSARIISTDVPLILFWSLALLLYSYLLKKPQKSSAILLGASIGLGLLSKYAMIYFVPGMLLAGFASSSAQTLLKTSMVWLALLVAVIVVAPNLIWNFHNAFLTIHHTGDLVLGEKFQPSVARVLEFIGSQFGVFGPVVFATMIVAMIKLRSSILLEQDRIMVAFFVTPLVFVTAISIGAHAYANWASVSAITGIILTAALLVRRGPLNWLYISVGIGVAAQLAFLTADAFAPNVSLPFVKRNPYSRTLGLRAFAEQIGHLATEQGAATIVSDDRGKFAALRYYWREKPIEILSWGTEDSPSFDLAHPLTRSAPEPILFVTLCPDMTRVQPFFANRQPLGLFVVPVGAGAGADRYFFATLISNSRRPLGILRQCES